jgi:transaldolase
VLEAMEKAERGILSIFAGRIADTGIDPIPHVLNITKMRDELSPKIAVLWASPREPLNLIHAIQSKADIITMTPTLINKVGNFGKDLDQYSLETVQMFTNDALDSGFQL